MSLIFSYTSLIKLSIGMLSLFIHSTLISQPVDLNNSLGLSISFPGKVRLMLSYDLTARIEFEINNDVVFSPISDLKLSFFRNHLGSSHFDSGFDWNLAFTSGGVLSVGSAKYLTTLPLFTTTQSTSYLDGRSINLGAATSYVLMGKLGSTEKMKKTRSQRVGNILFSFRGFHIHYLNDGGPPPGNYLGDGEDRFWTGGGSVGYITQKEGLRHLIEITFHKFTGYSDDAYQASGALFLDNVVYADLNEVGYNRGRYSLKYGFLRKENSRFFSDQGYAFSINLWNQSPDIQDVLHKVVTGSPYHPQIGKRKVDLELYRIGRIW